MYRRCCHYHCCHLIGFKQGCFDRKLKTTGALYMSTYIYICDFTRFGSKRQLFVTKRALRVSNYWTQFYCCLPFRFPPAKSSNKCTRSIARFKSVDILHTSSII